ncbi:putative phage tail protein, partial [Pseudoalteromonas sp. CAL260-MNA-CIBAN-0059]|uniref:putative phage tail protein n=1 Tax=Pseudoalteromonas sp. CAL260-MNA-CIBAN-0059 TaxID=3140430 RepID=UPI003325D9FB
MSISQELSRLDARAVDLQNEMDPAGVSELVPDWERVMNLPDPCLGQKPLFDDRRLAVRRRLLAVGSQTIG